MAMSFSRSSSDDQHQPGRLRLRCRRHDRCTHHYPAAESDVLSRRRRHHRRSRILYDRRNGAGTCEFLWNLNRNETPVRCWYVWPIRSLFSKKMPQFTSKHAIAKSSKLNSRNAWPEDYLVRSPKKSKMYYRVELVHNISMYNSRPVAQLLMVAKAADLIVKDDVFQTFNYVNNGTCFVSKLESKRMH